MFLYEKQFSLHLHVDFVVQLDEIFLVKNDHCKVTLMVTWKTMGC